MKSDPKAQWLAHKQLIVGKIDGITTFVRTTLVEMLPSVHAIKEGKLWEHGGYESFDDFCHQCLKVSRQHVYKLLASFPEYKALGINGEMSHNATNSPHEPEHNEPSKRREKRAKGREITPTIDIESTATPVTRPALADPVFDDAPPTCPHCGQPITKHEA